MANPQTADSNSGTASHAEIVGRGWDAVARGDWDGLVADYTADMVFVMPGQADMLHGKAAFRDALDNIGAALPPGFDITAMRQIADGEEVVSIIDWKATSAPMAASWRCCSALPMTRSARNAGSSTPNSGKPRSEAQRALSSEACLLKFRRIATGITVAMTV